MADVVPFVAGPFTGVNDTPEPFTTDPHKLQKALNCYIPDPVAGSAVYARPGTNIQNSAGPVLGSGGKMGQGVTTVVGLDGTTTNFIVVSGTLYRVTIVPGGGNGVMTFTAVTPTNVVIQNGAGNPRFVYMQSYNGVLIVNDGVNQPWFGTNLGASPITATPIAFNSNPVLSRATAADTKFGNPVWTFALLGVSSALAANAAAGTALPAGTIPADKWGIYTVQTNAAGALTVTAGAANFTTGYTAEGDAIATITPATLTTATLAFVGYFTVKTKAGLAFVGGTDALAGGAAGNVASQTKYYGGSGDLWTAWAMPEPYTASLFFILNTVGAGATIKNLRNTVAWCEPADQTTGYQQANFDNTHTPGQSGFSPLFALKGTEVGLYYSRALSWGLMTGTPGINFATTVTRDAVSQNVGCTNPATVQVFGRYLYFTDNNGRPWRFRFGGDPEPLWLQLRATAEGQISSGYGLANTLQYNSWAVIEPNLNLYIVGAWCPTAGTASPSTLHVFEARSGRYVGDWQLPQNGFATLMDGGGIVLDTTGNPALLLLGEGTASGTHGFCWNLARVSDAYFNDNGNVMVCSVTSQRFGYGLNTTWQVRQVRALQNNTSTPLDMAMTLSTSQGPGINLGNQSAVSATSEGGYRFVWTPENVGSRGLALIVSPVTTAANQWKLTRLEVDAEAFPTGPEEA